MKLPTRRVVRDGHEVTINAEDFDPAIHQEIAKEPEPEKPRFSLKYTEPEPEPEPEEEAGDEPFNLSECNVRDAAEVIAESDVAALDAFELEESTGHVRKGVLDAIKKQRAVLEGVE